MAGSGTASPARKERASTTSPPSIVAPTWDRKPASSRTGAQPSEARDSHAVSQAAVNRESPSSTTSSSGRGQTTSP